MSSWTDIDMARLALQRGWISEPTHDRVLAEADRFQALGLNKTVGDILVEEGCLTGEQARGLREALGLSLKRPRIGDYEIARRVGLGGMGTVFEATHVRLRQRIALKVLLPRLARDPRLTERFLREARALARLNHPHLVHAIDAGQDGEYYYLAMEFIEGENLLQVLVREGPVNPLRSVRMVRDVCKALAALEEQGLVHRDIKPANILLGPHGLVKLADLGLLKAVDESSPWRERVVCGTPHYVSPEQVRGEQEVDVRSDLYSLGATWYHICVGRPPFVGRNTREILEAHVSRPPPAPARLRPGIPPALERTLVKWLSKDPKERPQSAAAALEDLDQLARLLGERRGISGRALRLILAPLRWPPRRMAAAAGFGAAVLALAILPWGALDREEEARFREAEPPAVEPAPDRALAEPPPPPAATAPSAASASPAAPPALAGARSPGSPSSSPAGALVEARPLAAGAAVILRGAASLSRRASGALGEALSVPAARFRPLAPLARSFHASFVALEPGSGPPRGISLLYEFAAPAELEDFRRRPASFQCRGGELRGVSAPQDGVLDSVAWFASPLALEWELREAGRVVIGFGSLRVAPGRGGDALVWLAEPEGADPPSIPSSPAGRGAIEFAAGAVDIVMGASAQRLEAEVPERGRLLLRLGPGASLERLEVGGTLEPTWGQERVRLLSAPGR